jgi:hypothetical protein
MIVLLSALVVVVAAVVLVVGMVSGTFGLVYAGLALAAAGVVLLLIARFLGRSHAPVLSDAPAPLPTAEPLTAAPGVGAAPADPAAAFPLARYDSLWVTQIVPQLAGLSAEELAMVDARERDGRHRAGVLDAITAIRSGEQSGSIVAPGSTEEPTATDRPTPAVASSDAADLEADDAEPGREPCPAPEVTEPDEDDDVSDHDDRVEEAPVVADQVADGGRVPTFLGRPARPIHVHTS